MPYDSRCSSCAARRSEAVFPASHKPGTWLLCCACIAEAERAPIAEKPPRLNRKGQPVKRRVVTRRIARAHRRMRDRSPQPDMIDQLVPTP